MNALANSQMGELEKLLDLHNGGNTFTYANHTGEVSPAQREEILANPPDILLTNYVMLELIMARYHRDSGA